MAAYCKCFLCGDVYRYGADHECRPFSFQSASSVEDDRRADRRTGDTQVAGDVSEPPCTASHVQQSSPSCVRSATFTLEELRVVRLLVEEHSRRAWSDKECCDSILSKVTGIIASNPWDGLDSSAGGTGRDQ